MTTTTVLLLMAFSAVVLTVPSSKPAGTVFPALNTNGPTTPASTNTTTPASTNTTTPASTNTTTPASSNTTTPASTNTTTPASSNTTTPAPTTPAPSNSTSPAPSNTTTPVPTNATTTAIPPTTTKVPIATNGTVGNYTLDNEGQRCLMVQMELRIGLENGNRTFLLRPNETTIAGSCDNKTATLILRAQGFNLTMMFAKNETTKMTFVNGLIIYLTYDFSIKSFSAVNQEMTYKVGNNSVHFFSAKTGHSYSCRKESISMEQGIYLEINQERMQAFDFPKSNEFGIADPCPADQDNYRVAIAVGITLLVLVVVVVVAYLLARKKRTDGYQSL